MARTNGFPEHDVAENHYRPPPSQQFYEWEMVEGYEEFVRTGKPMALHAGTGGGDFWNLYQHGMRNVAGISADEIVRRLPIPPRAHDMLDLGGSHGYFSASLCRKYPSLQSVILDLPDAVEQASAILAKEKLGTRVVHRLGNALTDDFGEGTADIVFMSQFVHHFTDEQSRALVRKSAHALRPAGLCVILDFIRPRKAGEFGQGAALLDLYFAMVSESGTWPVESMNDWLQSAGLTPLKPIWLRTMPGAALVVGRKPATA